jgi:hypothetical protein
MICHMLTVMGDSIYSADHEVLWEQKPLAIESGDFVVC